MNISLGRSTQFSFNGKHCDEMGVAFLPSTYPFIPAMTIPTLTVTGRHGTLRYPGRTFSPTAYSGTLYLLDSMDETDPISASEMLSRASDIARWLAGDDGRGKLILDALDDRYFIAEVDTEAGLSDEDWCNGEAKITFRCQPYARSVMTAQTAMTLSANAAQKTVIYPGGNVDTLLAFSVKNTSSATLNSVVIEAPDTRFTFSDLGLSEGEVLRADYTDDDILLLRIEGVDGAVRSAMPMREPSSDDDLIVGPGPSEIAVKADRACEVRLAARGRWI